MSTRWTFLSHHAHVLLCIARDPDTRLREVASEVGITERAVQAIVNDLVEEGYLTRERVGRRNHYEIHPEAPMRHPMHHDIDVGTLVGLIERDQSREMTLRLSRDVTRARADAGRRRLDEPSDR